MTHGLAAQADRNSKPPTDLGIQSLSLEARDSDSVTAMAVNPVLRGNLEPRSDHAAATQTVCAFIR